MPKVKLTAKAVENAKPATQGQRLELFDASLPGFGLRIGDSSKSWFVFYRYEGKQKRLTLGHYPALGLGEAREKAGKALELVEAGTDPAAEKQATKEKARTASQHKAATGYAPGSFGALASLYMKQECPALRRGPNIESMINREIMPPWKDRPATDLRRRDLIALLDPIIETGMIQKAHKVREIVLRIVNWAIDRGDLEANLLASPSRGRKRAGILQRHDRDRVLSSDELKEIWLACEAMTGLFPSLVKTLILTGQRRSEVAGMRWSELNLEAAVWTIPGERYKTGVVHTVPLVPMIVSIIKSQPRISDEFVFAAFPDRPLTAFSRGKEALDRRIKNRRAEDGLAPLAPWTLHDLRRTLRTGLSELRIGSDIAERVIGHVIGGVKGVYDRHAYFDEKREALERWAAKVDAIINPPPDNIIPLHAAR